MGLFFAPSIFEDLAGESGAFAEASLRVGISFSGDSGIDGFKMDLGIMTALDFKIISIHLNTGQMEYHNNLSSVS